jgi:choice-of-anchor A domain-containing protein
MKKIITTMHVLAWLALTGGTCLAWHVEGNVLCASTGAPFSGLLITVSGTSNCGGAVTISGNTDSSGHYYIALPDCAGSFTVCLDTTGLPSDAILNMGACQDFTTSDSNEDITVSWTVNSSTCQSPPPCPFCVAPELGLGAAAGCTVLELGPATVSINGPAGGILGDICIAPKGSLAMSGDEYVTGTVRLGVGAHFQNSSHGTVNVQQNVDLSAQINAALAEYANAQTLPCTQTYTQLNGNNVTTITGSVGINVICVGDIVLSGKQIFLNGPAGARFIFNVTGKFVLTGGGDGPQIRVTGGVQPKDVLYNIIGTGQDVAFSGGGGGVNCCAAIVDGTLLAPYRKIALSPGLVNGEVISGMNISIVSGSSVRCPPCP